MKPVTEVTFCVIDKGLFPHVARKLGEQSANCYYWTPWDSAFPKIENGLIGDGEERVQRVLDFWAIKHEVDAFVFPDVGFGGLQKELIAQGYPVWGHRGSDELELNRGLFLRTLAELKMDVPNYEVVRGLTNLRLFLADKEDKYIKVSRWRGNCETFHWKSPQQDEYTLDTLAYQLGPAKELIVFYVLDAIETDIEDGIDTYCIDGAYPSLVMHGLEHKDKSYLCSIQKFADIDERVRGVNETLAPVMAKYGHRGAFSTEVRIKDDEAYFIDPTLRFGSPPSQVMVELFANFADIVWHGANGILIEPEPAATFGVQVAIKMDRTPEEWEAWALPEELEQWVKPSFSAQIDGMTVLLPSPIPSAGGWLVAIGDTIEETVETLREYRDLLPGGVDCDVTALAPALVEAEKAKDEGITFTDLELPGPEIVLNTNE